MIASISLHSPPFTFILSYLMGKTSDRIEILRHGIPLFKDAASAAQVPAAHGMHAFHTNAAFPLSHLSAASSVSLSLSI